MINIAKLKQEQLKLAGKVSLVDNFPKIQYLGGVDHSYSGEKIISVIVVWDVKTEKVVEWKYNVEEVKMPYIPGYLSYRETPSSVKAFELLDKRPDILLVDGNGILHPRKIGIASHLGLLLDMPTIGITKNLLCGELREDTVYIDKEAVGKLIHTKEKANPIFVSPGHKISLHSAIEIAKKCLKDHKLPEPLYQAHKIANHVKKKMKETTP